MSDAGLKADTEKEKNDAKLIELLNKSENESDDDESESDGNPKSANDDLILASNTGFSSQKSSRSTISAEQLRENIKKEVERINLSTLEGQRDTFHYYKCVYIFDGLNLDNLILGQEIVTTLKDHIVFEPSALHRSNIAPNDIFIKAGYLKKLIENNLHFTVSEKYLQTNTYSKTCKLGVKVKARNTSKRDIYYVKLRESLMHLREGICDNPEIYQPMKRPRKLSTSRPAFFDTISFDRGNSFDPNPTLAESIGSIFGTQPIGFDSNGGNSSVSQFIQMRKQLVNAAPSSDRFSFSTLLRDKRSEQAMDLGANYQKNQAHSSSHLAHLSSIMSNRSGATANTSRHSETVVGDPSIEPIQAKREAQSSSAQDREQRDASDTDTPFLYFKNEIEALNARLYTVELEVARLKAQRIVQMAQYYQAQTLQQHPGAPFMTGDPTLGGIRTPTMPPQWLPQPGHVMAVLPPGVSQLSKEIMDKAFYFGLTGQRSPQTDNPYALNPLESEFLFMDETGGLQLNEDQLLQYLQTQQAAESSRLHSLAASASSSASSSRGMFADFRLRSMPPIAPGFGSAPYAPVGGHRADLDSSFHSDTFTDATSALINMRQPGHQATSDAPPARAHDDAQDIQPSQSSEVLPSSTSTKLETATEGAATEAEADLAVGRSRDGPARRLTIELRKIKRDENDLGTDQKK